MGLRRVWNRMCRRWSCRSAPRIIRRRTCRMMPHQGPWRRQGYNGAPPSFERAATRLVLLR